ncbi:MAG: hypothetical protein JJ855_10160 [Rhodospirillales bacterium]|nr:hypothetical protein [Rhodospirillales bacterium]
MTPPASDQLSGEGIDDCMLPAPQVVGTYWRRLAGEGGGVPRYDDVNLMDLYKVAHLISVKDVIKGGEDFAYRFWGSELRRALGFEGTGKLVSQYEPENMRARLLDTYRGIVETHEPVLRRGSMRHVYHRMDVTYEVIHVPFKAPESEEISQIMSAVEFDVPLTY